MSKLKTVDVLYMGQIITIDSRIKFIAHNEDLSVYGYEIEPRLSKLTRRWHNVYGSLNESLTKLQKSAVHYSCSVRTVSECMLDG